MAFIESKNEIPTPAWQDINIPLGSLRTGASTPTPFQIPNTNMFVLSFNGTTGTDEVHGTTELLHDYLEGTDLHAHIHWAPTTSDAGNVKWQLEYAWVAVGGVVSSSTTISFVEAVAGVAMTNQLSVFPIIAGAGMKIGSRFIFRLFRNPADAADTYIHPVAGFDFGLHYQIDTIGSSQVASK
jgi:hypothetical protein